MWGVGKLRRLPAIAWSLGISLCLRANWQSPQRHDQEKQERQIQPRKYQVPSAQLSCGVLSMIQEKCGRAQSQGAEETGHHEGECTGQTLASGGTSRS